MTAAALEAPDEVAAAFRAALEQDAAAVPAEQPQQAAPPRLAVSADPEAPHGRAEDGTPLAPHGIGKNGRPRIKPAGPGRGGKSRADEPRTTTAPAATGTSSSAAAGPADYTEDLSGLAMSVWLAGSALRGGKFWILPLPDTRPYAAAWHQQMPAMVQAWNIGAQKNATVRGYVEKLAGDGSWSWVIGVAVASIPLVTACAQLATDPTARAAAAAVNDQLVDSFMTEQMQAMGLELPPAEAPA